MGMDLTKTAEGNAPARHAVADERLKTDVSGQLARFRDFAAGSAFATNVVLEKLELYERAEALMDARACCIARCGGDEVAGLALFADRQAEHLDGREGFEDLWEHGRRFVYGAVHAGGAGVESFGPVCLVLSDLARQKPDALGVFPQDTVQRYADASGSVDGSRALSEATAWADRAALAVVERAAAALDCTPREWPELLCSDDGYLEVDVAGPLSLEAIAHARIPDAKRVQLERLRAADLLGESISDVERAEARLYDVLHRWRRRNGMTIEGVPSA